MKVNVDGRELELPGGTSAIDAVFAAGLDVPYFCSQPYLSPIGACRMCLVEAGTPRKNPDGTFILDEATGLPKIFWMPKPMASCTLMATDGMTIISQSEKVKKAQAGMMEFTLINHPLDCPTCDKGGACELQDRAFEYGYGESRFEFDRRHAEKHYDLSEFVVLDQERCIHCKRCVRYFEEVPGNEVLDFIERGGHTFIDNLEDGLPSNFSGNITDICPVGALLDNVARFRGRNWEYDHTATTCTACSVGCAITVDARNGQLERIQGRENYAVNQTWLCDGGRFGHEWLREDRLTTPLVRREGKLVPATWEEAISALREGLQGVARANIGLYTKSDITLEEGIALERFSKQLGTVNVDHAPRYAVHSSLKPPTLLEVVQSDFVLVLGADVEEEAPVLALRIEEMLKGGLLSPVYDHGTAIADLRMVERVPRKRERLAVFSSVKNALHAKAGISAEYPAYAVLEDLTTDALALPNVAQRLEGAERPILILGAEALERPENVDLAEKIAGKYGAKLLILPAGPNSTGLAALELVPGVKGSGLSAMNISAALVSRLEHIPRDFSGFLVVHETHLTEVAARADVVLPASSNYEKRGTTVNLEGRLLLLQGAAINAGESADLMTVLGALGDALDLKPEIRGVRSAQRELQKRFNLDFSSLPQDGLIADLGAPKSAPTSSAHTPVVSMWQPEMLRSSRIREFVQGGSSVPLVMGGDD